MRIQFVEKGRCLQSETIQANNSLVCIALVACNQSWNAQVLISCFSNGRLLRPWVLLSTYGARPVTHDAYNLMMKIWLYPRIGALRYGVGCRNGRGNSYHIDLPSQPKYCSYKYYYGSRVSRNVQRATGFSFKDTFVS